MGSIECVEKLTISAPALEEFRFSRMMMSYIDGARRRGHAVRADPRGDQALVARTPRLCARLNEISIHLLQSCEFVNCLGVRLILPRGKDKIVVEAGAPGQGPGQPAERTGGAWILDRGLGWTAAPEPGCGVLGRGEREGHARVMASKAQLLALLAHPWRAVCRARRLEPLLQETTRVHGDHRMPRACERHPAGFTWATPLCLAR